MPIRINLLAESQAAEEMRRKDPVKRAAWIGGFVVSLVLIYSLWLQFQVMMVRSELRGLQSSWTAIEKDVKQVTDQRAETRSIEQKVSALNQFTTNRMLWANTLDALQHTFVDGVQIVRISAEQNFILGEKPPPPPGSPPGTPSLKPQMVTERIVLNIDGKDFGPVPGDQVPKYKEVITAHSYFLEQLQKTNNVQLTSLSAPQSEGGRTFRNFGFQLFYQPKERYLHE